MVCLSLDPEKSHKVMQIKGSNLHISFKNICETRICISEVTMLPVMSIRNQHMPIQCYNSEDRMCVQSKE